MKIDDLIDKKDDLDYDLVDDLVFFINHDTNFYREHAYPVIQKFALRCKKDKPPSSGIFKNVVRRAYLQYKEEYPSNNLSDQLNIDDLKLACDKLFKQEYDEVINKKVQLPESIDRLCESVNKWTS